MNLLKTLRNLPRRTLLTIVVAGIVLGTALIISFNLQRNGPIALGANSSVLHEQEKTHVGLPVRLEIPKIKVDAAFDYIGITSQGELGVPAGPANAGWYALGPRPGEKGNAVIDGHFGYRNNIPAVFDNLHTLQKGDKIYVKDEKGVTATFVIRELRTYGPDEYAPAVFRSSDGKAHLNLITCEGTWNQPQKSFSNRLVVFADKA